MRRFSFILLFVSVSLIFSCRNAGALGEKDSNRESVDSVKTVIADDLLDLLDEYAQKYLELGEDGKIEAVDIISRNLSEEEKLIRPDYLLDPGQAKLLVTRRQKINALAILSTELPLRKAYDMPTEEACRVIESLSAELNFPAFFPEDGENASVSEAVRSAYSQFKDHNALTDFWRYVCSMQNSLLFLMSKNVDAFASNVSPEEYSAIHERLALCIKVADMIAREDREVANAEYTLGLYGEFESQEEAIAYYSDFDNFKKSLVDGRAYYTARRAGILK